MELPILDRILRMHFSSAFLSLEVAVSAVTSGTWATIGWGRQE